MPSENSDKILGEALHEIREFLENSIKFDNKMWDLMEFLYSNSGRRITPCERAYVEQALKDMESNREALRRFLRNMEQIRED